MCTPYKGVIRVNGVFSTIDTTGFTVIVKSISEDSHPKDFIGHGLTGRKALALFFDFGRIISLFIGFVPARYPSRHITH